MRVLYVCTANICRSASAQRLLREGVAVSPELARLEARVALDTLRQQYPNLALLGNGERIPPFLFWGRCKLPVSHQ